MGLWPRDQGEGGARDTGDTDIAFHDIPYHPVTQHSNTQTLQLNCGIIYHFVSGHCKQSHSTLNNVDNVTQGVQHNATHISQSQMFVDVVLILFSEKVLDKIEPYVVGWLNFYAANRITLRAQIFIDL